MNEAECALMTSSDTAERIDGSLHAAHGIHLNLSSKYELHNVPYIQRSMQSFPGSHMVLS